MEERSIKISLERAREWYNKGGELKEIALSAFTEKEIKEIVLPNTWEEFCDNYPVKEKEYYIEGDCTINKIGSCQRISSGDKNILPSKQAAEQHLALMQLHQLRDCYRQGWVPNWEDNIIKYCIVLESNRYVIRQNLVSCYFLSFQSLDLAQKFLNNFGYLIRTAGDLI